MARQRVRKDTLLKYWLWTFVRRQLLAIVLVYGNEFPNLQLMANSALILTGVILTQYIRPFDDMRENRAEVFNECCLMIANYHLFCLTDFVLDVRTRKSIGMALVVFTCLTVVANVAPIMAEGMKVKALKSYGWWLRR